METNEINNKKLKEELANYSLEMLLSKNIINTNDLSSVECIYGYLFTKDDGVLEALYKLSIKDKNTYYFAAQNNKIMLLTIDEDMYNQTINYMHENHACLRESNVIETDIQKNRRLKNYEYLSNHHITANKLMPCLYEDSKIELKNIDVICKKAIASLIVIQIACDINNNKYKESLDFFLPILKQYHVEDYLNSKEKRIIDGTYSEQDAIDMDWAYEIYWAICWCLGLVDDIKDASKVCNCNMAISFVMNSKSFEEFKSKCNMRSISEILDMQDLYLRYNWAINEKKINPNSSIGNLNASNVIERRRGLEWVISKENDWYNISMSA